VLAFTALGILFGDIFTMIAAWFPQSISVNWILIKYAFGGLCGAFLTTILILQSYAANYTLLEERSVVFGYFHSCMYIGFAIGPFLGSLVIKAFGDILILFYIAFVYHLIFIILVLFLIPKSLLVEH
jgi:MFS family permease